jgi:hypothetical protein
VKSIPELERKRRQVEDAFVIADKALVAGKISQHERDAYLEHLYGTRDPMHALAGIDKDLRQLRDGDGSAFTHKAALLITSFFIVMISLFALLFSSTGGVTGAVVFEIPDGTTYAQDAAVPVALEGATRVNVTGIASGLGDATVTLVLDGARYTLYEYRHAGPVTAHASLERSRYEEGETVSFIASDVSSAYLMTDADAIALGNGTSVANLTAGAYAFTLIIDDAGALSQEELPFTVVPAGTPAPNEAFATCGELCRTNLTGNATLEITLEGDATITLEKITLGTQGNGIPVLVRTVPDVSGESRVVLDLALFFQDPDGDPLMYSSSQYEENNETIDAATLTIAGPPGTYTYVAYASDLAELTSSNLFTVTLTGNEPAAQENASNASEPHAQNGTLPPAAQETNMTLNESVDTLNCDDPDPNKRHVDCLNVEAQKYFEEDVFLENVDRAKVARVTPIGNLLLTGRIVRYDASGNPGDRDFTIGYKDLNFLYRPTIWIDPEGNLHLRGTVHEENENLIPPSGSYAIINRRGVYLAYADPETGDLYVRGNAIPYREDVFG